jgi:hypothetical protein
MKIDKLANTDAKSGALTRLVEDGNEMLFYLSDLYEVVVQYKPYETMLTDCLIKVFYVPIVLQSLCVFTLK